MKNFSELSFKFQIIVNLRVVMEPAIQTFIRGSICMNFFFRNWEWMPESELLNHFQCNIHQCVLSNSENDNTNMKIILYKGEFII